MGEGRSFPRECAIGKEMCNTGSESNYRCPYYADTENNNKHVQQERAAVSPAVDREIRGSSHFENTVVFRHKRQIQQYIQVYLSL